MGFSRHKKSYKTIKGLTHNQVVPGSSPGGTTSKIKQLQFFAAAFFIGWRAFGVLF